MRHNHPAAALTLVGSPDFASEAISPPDIPTGFAALRRAVNQEGPIGEHVRTLANLVGGIDPLERLDAEPLIDEPFAWSTVRDADREAVRALLALTDACCDQWLDVEYRTIVRRLIARISAHEVTALRGRAAPRSTAAALVWLAVSGNGDLDGRTGRWRAKDVWSWFAASSNGERGRRLLRAAALRPAYETDGWHHYVWGGDVCLADVALLHGRYRVELLGRRLAAVALAERAERARAGRRPMIRLDDGLMERNAVLADVHLTAKSVTTSRRSMVVIGITALVPEPEIELYALSVPEAYRLVAMLKAALDDPHPRHTNEACVRSWDPGAARNDHSGWDE